MRKFSAFLSAAAVLGIVALSNAQNVGRVVDQVIAVTCSNQFVRSIAASGLGTCATVSLTADVSGVLPIANGGANSSTGPFVVSKVQSFCPSGCTTTVASGASGTYTPSTGMLYAVIECIGGGGGGGGSAASGVGAQSAAGSGGAGSYSRVTVSAATIGASKAVTIGALGTAGAAGNNAGGNGGDTSVTTLCVGKGATGGFGAAAGGTGGGGAGGIAGTGDIKGIGQSGNGGLNGASASLTFAPVIGPGGSAIPFGTGGALVAFAGNASGNAGTGCGSGGTGAISYNNGGTQAGSAGTAGCIFVTEYTNQ